MPGALPEAVSKHLTPRSATQTETEVIQWPQLLDEAGFGTQNEDTLKDKFLTFSLAEEDYGIEIRYVIEIIGIQKITKVPNLPTYIKGVINLRGKVIPGYGCSRPLRPAGA